jgi:hypothetical protein
MEASSKDKAANEKGAEKDALAVLRHDINNQLSNILLALSQLRYEMPDASEDCIFYLDSISTSAEKIGALVKKSESPEAGKKE